jgi:transposase
VEKQGVATSKKNASRLGAHIVFVDESGFMLIPCVRKTWAPKGKTPIHHHLYRHTKISVITALTVSPMRNRLGLYFRFHFENIKGKDVSSFLSHLMRHIRGPIIVIWDNAQIHKGQPIRKLCKRHARLHLEALPPYAPELNPDEGVYAYAKRALANGQPRDEWDLLKALLQVLSALRCSPSLLKGFIKQSDLPLF